MRVFAARKTESRESRELEPVRGWEAIPIMKATGDGALKAGTYRVKSCPEYIPDEVKEK